MSLIIYIINYLILGYFEDRSWAVILFCNRSKNSDIHSTYMQPALEQSSLIRCKLSECLLEHSVSSNPQQEHSMTEKACDKLQS